METNSYGPLLEEISDLSAATMSESLLELRLGLLADGIMMSLLDGGLDLYQAQSVDRELGQFYRIYSSMDRLNSRYKNFIYALDEFNPDRVEVKDLSEFSLYVTWRII